jgi:hypothetical protein
VILGSLLAVLCGVANSAAAALEKRETVQVGGTKRGLRLLVVLVRRPWWLLAMTLSVVGWSAEAGALGLAPVPVVTTLRSLGRGGLVLVGHRWLAEHFGRVELGGLLLITIGGVMTASSAYSSSMAARPLSNVTELGLAVVVAVLAVGLTRVHNGLVLGAAVGLIFVATGVYTKEIGDRFVREGLHAVPGLLATPGPWLMVVFSVWGIGVLQGAFRHANAASVSASSTAVSADGLIAASAVLYRQPLATGAVAITVLAAGVVLATAGAVALALGGRASEQAAPPATGGPPALDRRP